GPIRPEATRGLPRSGPVRQPVPTFATFVSSPAFGSSKGRPSGGSGIPVRTDREAADEGLLGEGAHGVGLIDPADLVDGVARKAASLEERGEEQRRAAEAGVAVDEESAPVGETGSRR